MVELNRKNDLVYNSDERIKSHSLSSSLADSIDKLKKKLAVRSYATIEEQCLILDEMTSFPLGQFIISNGGTNGAWTDYLISPHEYIEMDARRSKVSFLESFFLFHSPAVLAQRELFVLSKKFAQKKLQSGSVLASIPCGLMRDLLSLDFSKVCEYSLVGIDIDPSSLDLASHLAKTRNINNVIFVEKDAWKLDLDNEFDFINSIGLNVYESDRESVIDLYKQWHRALKTEGILFTGVLTWPPYINASQSDWIVDKIPKFILHLEKIIHKDILELNWLNFRMLSEIESDFRCAGFSKVHIYPDPWCVFPAVVAIK